MTEYAKDTGFKTSGMAAPLIFIALFIFFVYGALFIGLMGISNTIIHEHNLSFFTERGVFGAFLGVCCILAAWVAFVCICAGIPYYILKRRGKAKTARLTGQVILILMFHVFAIPFILWVMVRNSSPKLRARRVAKLRRKLQAREAEAARLKTEQTAD